MECSGWKGTCIQFLFQEMAEVVSVPTFPRAEPGMHVDHPVPQNRILCLVWMEGRARERLREEIGRYHWGRVWSSCYHIGGLLREARLNPGFMEV